MSWILAFTLALALVCLLYQWLGSRYDLRRAPAPGVLVELGKGRRLHLSCRGSGRPAVVFDAGIAATSLSWTHVQPRVAEFARACSYDRAGLGWSDAGARPISAASLADELHGLLVAARVAPPYVLVGHSFGSFVVRAFANRYTDLVCGMVLVDPIYPSEWLEMSPKMRWRLSGGIFLSRVGALLARVGMVRACLRLLARGSTGVPRRVSRFFGSEAAQFLGRIVGEVQKLPRETWPAVQTHWSQPKCFSSMADHLRSLPQSAAEIAAGGDLGHIPLVVITAASQPEASRAEHRAIAQLSTQGRHIVARKSGHWVLLDEPELVVDAIRNVIQSASAFSGFGETGFRTSNFR
jgi:pimeloyl-ACP methyl ester carboxylesterase